MFVDNLQGEMFLCALQDGLRINLLSAQAMERQQA